MSLILEALRKSEAERRRGQAPDLHAELPPVAQARPSTPPVWRWLAAAAALLLVGVLGGRGWLSPPLPTDTMPRGALPDSLPAAGSPSLPPTMSRDPGTGFPAAVDRATEATGPGQPMTALPIGSPPPRPAREAVPPVSADVPTAGAQSVPAPAPARPEPVPPVPTRMAPAPPSASPDPTGSRLPASATSALPAPAQPSPAQPAPGLPVAGLPAPATAPTGRPASSRPASPVAAASAADSNASVPAAPISLADLTPDQRRQLPPLKLSMHLWSADPARRFVILDGHRLAEGDRTGAAVIERIGSDHVVLAWNGYRIRLSLR